MGFFGQQALIRFIVPFMNLFNQTMPCNYRFQGFVGSLVWHSFRIADNEVLRWVSSEALAQKQHVSFGSWMGVHGSCQWKLDIWKALWLFWVLKQWCLDNQVFEN